MFKMSWNQRIPGSENIHFDPFYHLAKVLIVEGYYILGFLYEAANYPALSIASYQKFIKDAPEHFTPEIKEAQNKVMTLSIVP